MELLIGIGVITGGIFGFIGLLWTLSFFRVFVFLGIIALLSCVWMVGYTITGEEAPTWLFITFSSSLLLMPLSVFAKELVH